MNTTDADPIISAAHNALQREQYLEACKLLESAFKLCQQHKTARDLAFCLNLANKFDESEIWFRKAAELANQTSANYSMERVRKCPLCRSPKARKIWVGNITEVYPETAGILNPIRIWVECLRCKMVYADPRPKKDSLERYYSAFYTQSQKGIQGQVEPNHAFLHITQYADQVNILEELRGIKGGRLLEIGSGLGFMLSVFNYFGWEASGLEIDPSAVAFSKKTFNCNVIPTDLHDFQWDEQNNYDAIVMLEVLEHLIWPKEEVQKIYDALAPGGILVISTPDLQHPYHMLLNKRDGMWVVPSHLTYWSKDTLIKLLTDMGLSILQTNWSLLYRGSIQVYAQKPLT